MEIGILVVYMVNKENERLLDIHLDQIEKNTNVPYRIYCVVKKPTSEACYQRLKINPKIRILETKTPGCPASVQHSTYLRRLTDFAIKDNITHLAVFHLDSFPVKPFWAEDLAEKTTGNCVLAAIVRYEDKDRKPHCSGMFFTKKFYTEYEPTWRLSEKVMKRTSYKQYCEANSQHIVPDTGVGFGYRLFLETHLSWHSMPRSNKRNDHKIMAGIYGDTFFHLGGATRKINRKDYRIACDLTKNRLSLDPDGYLKYLRGL